MTTTQAEAVTRTPIVRSSRRGVGLDLVGTAAAAGLGCWTYLAATSAGVEARSALAALGAAIVAYVLARLAAYASTTVVPLLVIAAGSAVFVSFTDEVLSSSPRVGPFGYSSITGAFFLQCAFGALMLLGSRWALWPVGVLAALVFGAVTLGTETRAAVILLPALGLPALFARRPSWSRRLVVAYGLLVTLALGTSVWLGATYRGDQPTGIVHEVVDATISERRHALWYDAIQITLDHPLRGVGPGGFADHSPVARSDPDEPWAHNEFLQAGADLGFPGLIFLVALFVWAFARLAIAGGNVGRGGGAAVVALGAAALAALAIHACIEYVLQRPAVPAVAAALVGTALGPFRIFGGRHGRLAGA